MLVAEIAALKQTNLKRVFAYSSLGQVALIFTAFALFDIDATVAALFIVFAHSVAKVIIFLALTCIEKEYKSIETKTLKKLNSPFLRVTMLIAMLSLLGIPLFAGFVGKFLVLKSLALSGLIGVLATIVIASLLESIYYFKLIGFMFSKEERREPLKINPIQKLLFSFLMFLLVFVGIAPFLISGFFHESAQEMLDATTYITSLVGEK